MDRYSKFKNAISHQVHELKSSAADDIMWSKKEKYSLTHDASSFMECQSLGITPVSAEL